MEDHSLKDGRFLISLFLVYSIACHSFAGEWKWSRVAWEDTTVFSIAIPADSNQVVYTSVGGSSVSIEEMGVYKSLDGGATWKFLPESNSEWMDPLCIDQKNSAAIFCGSACAFFDTLFPELYPKKSEDAGEHWEPILEPLYRIIPSPWINGLLMATSRPQEGWGLYRSTDGGNEWTILSYIDVAVGVCDNVVFHHADSLMVFSWIDMISEWGLGRSHDGGIEWEIVLNGMISTFDQDPTDGNHWVAMIYRGQSEPLLFAESFDNGDSWETWPLPEPILHVDQLSFDRFDPRIMYVVESMDVGMGIYRSIDGGHEWAPMNEGFPTTDFTFEIFQVNSGDGRLLAARRDGLWKWTDQQSSDPAQGALPALFRIESVYPVPFSRSVWAELSMRSSGTVAADVYSPGGTLIRRLFRTNLGEGLHSIIWDGRSDNGRMVAPGTFILRVETEKSQASRILVKLK